MLNRIIKILETQTPQNGENGTYLPDVTFFRSDTDLAKAPLIYDQCLCIAVQGSKTCHMNETTLSYSADQFVVVPTILPINVEAFTDGDKPLLAVTIALDYQTIQEAVQMIGSEHFDEVSPDALGMYLEPFTDELQDCVFRLVKALESNPTEAEIIGRPVLKEIYYRVLMGQNGHVLASAARGESNFAKVSSALRVIHGNYSAPLDVPQLAETARMSVRAFHKHFKSITSYTPVQYLKRIRLEKARLFMVNEGRLVSNAAFDVGYESASQFSREFKRHFGYSPREARQMQ